MQLILNLLTWPAVCFAESCNFRSAGSLSCNLSDFQTFFSGRTVSMHFWSTSEELFEGCIMTNIAASNTFSSVWTVARVTWKFKKDPAAIAVRRASCLLLVVHSFVSSQLVSSDKDDLGQNRKKAGTAQKKPLHQNVLAKWRRKRDWLFFVVLVCFLFLFLFFCFFFQFKRAPKQKNLHGFVLHPK